MLPSHLYRAIVESSGDGIWLLAPDGRTVFANQRLADMLRVDRSAMVGHDLAEFLDDTGRAQWERRLTTLRSEGPMALPVECHFVRPDGSSAWFLVTEALLHGEGEASDGLLLTLSDHDERRRLQAELEESRRELLEAQRTARLASWSWVAATDRVTVSPTMTEMFGTGDSGVPRSWQDALAPLGPVQRAEVDAANQPLVDGEADTASFDVPIDTGSDRQWLRVRAVAHRDAHGTLQGLSGTTQDVTDFHIAEQSLADLAHQNQLMARIAVAANESRTLHEALLRTGRLVIDHDDWSRARAFWPAPHTPDGLELAEAMGTSDDAVGDPGMPARELRTAQRALAAREAVWDDDVRLSLASPVMLGPRVVAVIVISSDPPLVRHEVIGAMARQVVVQLSTVAEREATASELADARDAAMAASRQKSSFLATMSHEIRTPLNGVIGLNDLLQTTPLDPHQQRLAAGVEVSGRALLGLVDDILDFSKIEAGRLVLESIPLDVREVLEDVAAMTTEAASARSVRLVTHCDRDVPSTLHGDRVRLTQVVANLVSNAVKFTDAGEVVVRAEIAAAERRTASGERVLRVSVTDTGIGIAPDQAAEIFEPFVQADTSTTRQYGGTGLGLAIVREIVSALGGEVGVDSEIGAGSTFWFTAVLADPATGAVEAPTGLTGRRVLVVGDHAAERAAEVETLAHWGVDVGQCPAADAPGSLADAARAGRPYDVVLLTHEGSEPPLVTRTSAGVPVVCLCGPGHGSPGDVDVCLERPVTGIRLREAIVALHDTGPSPVSGTRTADPVVSVGDAPDPSSPGRRGRVLVVEDTPVNQMVAEGMLAALGYETATADDGVQALERLDAEAGTFDLVLMDVQMPRMDGYDTARAIRERECAAGTGRIPIVAMTAAAVTGERERCLDSGMDDFLTKPVTPARMAGVLARHLAAPEVVGPGGAPPPTDRAGVPQALRAHLDLDRLDMLRDLDPGDTSYLDRVIGNFVARTPDLSAAVAGALAAGDATTVMSSAHRLRGSALNLGVPLVAEAAMALELLGESGELAGAAEMLAQLESALVTGREAVQAYRASYAGP